MLAGRLFDRVAAAFSRQLLSYVTKHGRGTGDKQQNPLTRERRSHVRLYRHKPWSAICIWLEAKARSSRLVLYALVYGYGSLIGLLNYVLSSEVPSVYLGDQIVVLP